MSSRRSRSGGRTTVTTERRWYRSSRNSPALTAASRSRFVAATMRTSTVTTRAAHPLELALLDGAQELRLRRERQLADLVEEQRPAVGELEAALRPAAAPVNAPFSWPKSSLSRSASGSAAQLSATNGLPVRGLDSWSARATSSLPVPLSPRTSTVARLRATRSTRSSTSRMRCPHAHDPGEPRLGRARLLLEHRAPARVLELLQPDARAEHARDDVEEAQVAIERDRAGAVKAIDGEHAEVGPPVADGDAEERPRLRLEVAPGAGAIQEERLLADVRHGDRHAGREDPPDDPLSRPQPPEDPFAVPHLRRRLDEHLAGHRVEERHGPVLHPEVDLQHHERRVQRLAEIGREPKDARRRAAPGPRASRGRSSRPS